MIIEQKIKVTFIKKCLNKTRCPKIDIRKIRISVNWYGK